MTSVCLLASLTTLGCPDGASGSDKVDTSIESDDTGEEFYKCAAYDCACSCSAGLITGRILQTDICIPVSAASSTAHCEDEVCPSLEIALNFARGDAGLACDISCVVEEVRPTHPASTCGTCESVRFFGTFDETEPDYLRDDNYEEFTFSYSGDVCSSGGAGPTGDVCREGMPITASCVPDEEAPSGPPAPPEGVRGTGSRSIVASPSPLFAGTSSGTCLSGGGQFALVPDRRLDRNGDGRQLEILRPVQVSGSGLLTTRAWITRIGTSYAYGARILALRPGRPVRIGTDDWLVDETGVAFTVPTIPTQVPLGELGGGTPFLSRADSLADLPTFLFGLAGWAWGPPVLDAFQSATRIGGGGGAIGRPMLDIEWSCPPNSPDLASGDRPRAGKRAHLALDPPTMELARGSRVTTDSEQYQFGLSDIGCPVEWPQKFSMAVGVGRSDTPRLSFAIAGQPSARRSVSLSAGPHEPGLFRYDSDGVVIEGQLLAADASAAVVAVHQVTYEGLAVCMPGIYSLKAQLPS